MVVSITSARRARKTRRKNLAIFLLIVLSGIIFYDLATDDFDTGIFQKYERVEIFITRVLDGDTIETNYSDFDTIRLKGINTPESGELYSGQATEFLEFLVLNKSIEIESTGIDIYGRELGYLYLDGLFVNQALLEQGLAHLYIYEGEEDIYDNELRSAEQQARDMGLGIWARSSSYGCIQLIELRFDEGEKRCTNNEALILKNLCSYDLEVTIKDESASHIYKETLEPGLNEFQYSCIWNDAGDSLFIWDSEGLVLFYRY